jgi:release factor glutamine methyltransferase
MPEAAGLPTAPAARRLGDLLAAGTGYLERHGVAFPRVACELLVARLLACPRLELFRHVDQPLSAARVAALRRGLKRVAMHEPVQYVLGEWDFRGLTLTVDRRALIPRPETEELLDLVLATPDVWAHPSPFILDVGTGTGCIVLSLARERPQGRYVAIDVSAAALALARENAVRTGLAGRVEFREARGCGEFAAGSADAIVSNPPYIRRDALPALAACIRDHEPALALDGGPDGLDVIRAIAHDAAMVLRPNGWLFLEIGDDQGMPVRDLLEDLGFVAVAIRNDCAGRTRFAIARHGG